MQGCMCRPLAGHAVKEASGSPQPKRAGRKRLQVDHITMESLQEQGLFDVPIQVRSFLCAAFRTSAANPRRPQFCAAAGLCVRRRIHDAAANVQTAAQELGVGLSVLKRICRQIGLARWPFRTRQSLRGVIAKTEQYLVRPCPTSRPCLLLTYTSKGHSAAFTTVRRVGHSICLSITLQPLP